MNQIIQRLSEVETAASSSIEEAGAKKKQMAKDQDARIAAIWTVFMRKAIRRSPDSCWQRLWRNNFYGIISVVPKKSYEKG